MSASYDRPTSPAGSTTEASNDLSRQAAEWLVRRNEGVTPAERREFEAWLAVSPAHRHAFAAMEDTWRRLNEPRNSGCADILDGELARRRMRRRHRYTLLATGLGAAAVIAFGVMTPTIRVPPASPTVVVQPDQRTLPDGSVVELKAGADITVAFSPGQRGVRLLQCEALFQVAKDPNRPFVVTAGGVEVRAVGTAFAVSHHPEHVTVLVTEGRVAVERTSETAPAGGFGPATTFMGKGERLVVPANAAPTAPLTVTPVSVQQIAAGLAWRGKRVEFNATTVAEAIRLFNGQNAVQLAAGDAAIARLQLSGIFWSDDPEGFVRLLERGMNVRAERANDRIVLRSR